MRITALMLIAFTLLISCNQQPPSAQEPLKQQIDSLRTQLKNTYKPGLGEFMLDIQIHHAKLWYAGHAGNWQLADYELGQIDGTLSDVKKFYAGTAEIKPLNMVSTPMDSIRASINNKSQALFSTSFSGLTNACNNCHTAVKYEMNVITIPAVPPVSNQKFDL